MAKIMYKFINNLSYDFIDKFAKKLGLKNYYIRHDVEGWHIIFNNEKLWDNNILITDFGVQTNISKEFCKQATKLFQAEMYKIHGKKYLRELKAWLLYVQMQKHLTEKKIIKEMVKKISEEKVK